MRNLQTLRQELKDARQEVRNLTVMAMRPDQTPEKAELVLKGLRSARAEVKLRVMALQYAEKLAAPAVRTGPPARPVARPGTPAPPLATSSTPSDDRLRAAIALGLQMANAEARRMLAMSTAGLVERAPAAWRWQLRPAPIRMSVEPTTPIP